MRIRVREVWCTPHSYLATRFGRCATASSSRFHPCGSGLDGSKVAGAAGRPHQGPQAVTLLLVSLAAVALAGWRTCVVSRQGCRRTQLSTPTPVVPLVPIFAGAASDRRLFRDAETAYESISCGDSSQRGEFILSAMSLAGDLNPSFENSESRPKLTQCEACRVSEELTAPEQPVLTAPARGSTD